jgi:hypothetical protein
LIAIAQKSKTIRNFQNLVSIVSASADLSPPISTISTRGLEEYLAAAQTASCCGQSPAPLPAGSRLAVSGWLGLAPVVPWCACVCLWSRGERCVSVRGDSVRAWTGRARALWRIVVLCERGAGQSHSDVWACGSFAVNYGYSSEDR